MKQIYDFTVRSIVLYGSKTLVMTQRERQQLTVEMDNMQEATGYSNYNIGLYLMIKLNNK